jgi:diphthamide synthase subunit DPH2
MDCSVATDWESAVLEWEVFDCEEDEDLQAACICGKEELRYLFTIRNILNGNLLYPIGSSCIKKFERDDLDDDVAIKEQLFKLLHAIENNEFITLSSDLFSRKLLGYLYDEDVFQANSYNRFNPEVDYEFLLKMFNKRHKDSISTMQQRKISAIIMSSIRPYLRSVLQDKVKQRR